MTGLPDPRQQQAQAHALGAGVSRRLAEEYKVAIVVAEKRISELVILANRRRASGLPVPPSWAIEQAQMREMKQQMGMAMQALNVSAGQTITEAKREAVVMAENHAQAWLGKSFYHLQTSAVEEIVKQIHNARPGTPFGAAMARYPRAVNRKMESVLVQAVALGYGPAKTVRLFRQQMAGPYRNYDNLARTEIMGAYTKASIASYRENQHLLNGWQWLIEPTGALCPFCAERADKIYPLSEAFKSHPSCRCSTIPVVKNDVPLPPPPVKPPPVKPPPPPVKPPPVKPPPPRPPRGPDRLPGETIAAWNKRYVAWQQEQLLASAKPIPEEVKVLQRKIAALGGSAAAKAIAHNMLETSRVEQKAATLKPGTNFKSGYSKERIMDKAVEAEDWIRTHANGALIGGKKVTVVEEANRSYYVNSKIAMTSASGTRIHVHELGHWIEDMNPEILQQSKIFLARRTAGEEARKMSDITGNKAYGPQEVTKPDKFYDPYIGKEYSNATEVLSMGMEMLYEDPVYFANVDPEHFQHTVAAMHGHYNEKVIAKPVRPKKVAAGE